MNKIKLWILKKVVEGEVKQDYNHYEKIANLYRIIYDAYDKEFTEDNVPTREYTLLEIFECTLQDNNLKHKIKNITC